jgi:superfamily II DNA or RNA helicase
MKTCKLIALDQVNIKFDGLEPHVRREISEACKYFVPWARHSDLFKMGRWDGKVAFATAGAATFINMLDVVEPIILKHGYDIQLVDNRPQWEFTWPEVSDDMLSHKVWPKGHPVEGDPIILRDYQVEAIERYLKYPQSIQCISTGSGKTLITAALSAIVEPYGRTIVIVPSKDLVKQTEADYRNLGLDVGVFYGPRKEFGHQHTICTWQSLGAFQKKSKRHSVDITIDQFLEGVVCVMVDEVHSAKADVLKDLLTGPMAGIPIRWGLTGTIPKEVFEQKALLCSLGPVVGEIRADTLQELGVLAKCEVNIMKLQEEDILFKTFAAEYEFTTTNPDRIKWLAKFAIETAKTGNTLILVDRIESGKMLLREIGEDRAVFVYGNTKSDKRKEEYDDVQTADGKIIIATYGVAAVGINIPRIFNLILLEAGKSFVRVIQSIGRGIRTAKDKDFVNVYDITSTFKYSTNHCAKRKGYFREANYPFIITKVNYRNEVYA